MIDSAFKTIIMYLIRSQMDLTLFNLVFNKVKTDVQVCFILKF